MHQLMPDVNKQTLWNLVLIYRSIGGHLASAPNSRRAKNVGLNTVDRHSGQGNYTTAVETEADPTQKK